MTKIYCYLIFHFASRDFLPRYIIVVSFAQAEENEMNELDYFI